MIDTSNTVTKQVAKALELPEDIIKKVYEFYWKEGIKESIRSGKNLSIRVAKLGTFVVSKRKVNLRIHKYIAYLRHLRLQEPSSFKRMTKEQTIEKYVDDLKLLLELRNQLAKLYIENEKNHKLFKASLGE